jgi:hypothetical protein
MRIFRREIEITLKTLGVLTLAMVVTMSVAWGFEQRRQAKTWQSIACAYRMKEIARSSAILARAADEPDACSTLDRLGLTLDLIRYAEVPR